MILNSDIHINGKLHSKGSYISPASIYPFFLFHMLLFGGSGFFMAYFLGGLALPFLYMHGGIAIFVYTIFYVCIFGIDEVKWLVINSLTGIIGVYAEVDLLLSYLGKDIESYNFFFHVIPFTYYVMYTFLLRQAIFDYSGANQNPEKKERIEKLFVAFSLVIYAWLYFIRTGN